MIRFFKWLHVSARDVAVRAEMRFPGGSYVLLIAAVFLLAVLTAVLWGMLKTLFPPPPRGHGLAVALALIAISPVAYAAMIMALTCSSLVLLRFKWLRKRWRAETELSFANFVAAQDSKSN